MGYCSKPIRSCSQYRLASQKHWRQFSLVFWQRIDSIIWSYSHWGELFADPGMQGLKPNPELMGLIPGWQAAGCRRVLDAGCGVGRHLWPLLQAGFKVAGADCDPQVLKLLQARLAGAAAPAAAACLVQADLNRLPFASGAFDLVVSVNVINHGDA